MVGSLIESNDEIAEVEKVLHKTISSIRTDIEKFQFNTCMSRIMEYSNALVKLESQGIPRFYIEQLLLLLAPFAPHLTEELWEQIGNSYSIHNQDYPNFDPDKIHEDVVMIGIQVNGKLRGEIGVTSEDTTETVKEKVMKLDSIFRYIEGKEIKKFIYVSKKIVNIVVC